jgi:Relaxase/Mobilisation nuclease domain
MISKPVPANSFYHTCRYIANKPGSELLLSEGVRTHDNKLMAADFEMQKQLRPSKTMACFHSILSFYPGEKPTDDVMREIAKKYLSDLGIVNTQYAVSKHTDKAHLHMHIVANMVNNDGKAITDSWIGLRGKKIAQQLTQQYQLIPALEKNLALTNTEALSQVEATKYKIYIAIAGNLPLCKTMDELEKKLLKLGIGIQYKYKSQTNEKQGISFKMGNISFKGSQVDRKFSFSGLQKTLELQQTETLEQQQKQKRVLSTIEKIEKHKLQISAVPLNKNPDVNSSHSNINLSKDIGKIFETLLEPALTADQMPYELSQKALLQKKKKQKHGISR